MTSGRHVKLDLIELIQVTDDVNAEVWFEERAAIVVPVTAGKSENSG